MHVRTCTGALQALFCIGLLALQSCKELLPAYEDPRDVFDAYQYGFYEISITENAVKVYFTVVNTYDETFDARAMLSGTLILAFDQDRSFKKTVPLGPSLLLEARGYDPSSGNLRFDPGDSIRFGYSWNMVADDGRSLFNIDEVRFIPDPQCPRRLISTEPIRITLQSDVRLYERVDVVAPSLFRFSFTLHRSFVASRDCFP